MNKLKVFITFVLLVGCLSFFSCSEGGPTTSEMKEQTWSTAKSPSGRCYEVLTHQVLAGNTGFGFMGMAEIPCSEMRD